MEELISELHRLADKLIDTPKNIFAGDQVVLGMTVGLVYLVVKPQLVHKLHCMYFYNLLGSLRLVVVKVEHTNLHIQFDTGPCNLAVAEALLEELRQELSE